MTLIFPDRHVYPDELVTHYRGGWGEISLPISSITQVLNLPHSLILGTGPEKMVCRT